jgi:L-rhamnose mutarotase
MATTTRGSRTTTTTTTTVVVVVSVVVVTAVVATTTTTWFQFGRSWYNRHRHSNNRVHDDHADDHEDTHPTTTTHSSNGNKNWQNIREVYPAPRRFGACIRLHPDQYTTYRILHDQVWEAVQERMYVSHIRNFTIYYHPETSVLYQSFEWIGHWDHHHHHHHHHRPKTTTTTNNENEEEETTHSLLLSMAEEQQLLAADFDAIRNDPITREWWKLCEPCQLPFAQWDHHHRKENDDDDVLLPSQGGTKGDWWAPMECICHTGHWPIAYTQRRNDPDFVPLQEKKN